MSEDRIIRRSLPKPEGRVLGGENIWPPELEELVNDAIVKTRALGEKHGVMTAYEFSFQGIGMEAGSQVHLETPLASPSHQYDVSIATVLKALGKYRNVNSDFVRVGNPVWAVKDRVDHYEGLHQGRIIYRRVYKPSETKPIKDLRDNEAIELMRDVLVAEPDLPRIQQLYRLRNEQMRSGKHSIVSVQWAKEARGNPRLQS